MTFEDMMAMRRLGATDVSPDGKWLLYSVTDVDLAKNEKINRIYIQEIAGGQPRLVETAQPGDDGAASRQTVSTFSSSPAATTPSEFSSPISTLILVRRAM